MKTGLLQYDHLVNVKCIPELKDISMEQGEVVIGATATHTEIEENPIVREQLPVLAELERNVANLRVRNVGTLAGNLCFAEPHADPATLLLIHEASVTVVSSGGTRRLAIDELQMGSYETCLESDALLVNVRVPVLPKSMCEAYIKFGYHHRPTLGIAAAMSVQNGVISDVRLALGCVSPIAKRLPSAESILEGERIDSLVQGAPAIKEAGRAASQQADAGDDLHGSADYKEHLVGVFLERAIHKALSQNGVQR